MKQSEETNQESEVIASSEISISSLMRRITSGTFNYGLGSVLPQMIGFFLIPLYTRFLTPEDYGTADVVVATGAVLFVFMRVGVAGALTRFYFERENQENADQLRSYISTVVIFLTLWSFGLGITLTIFGSPLFALISPGVKFYPLMLMGIWTVVLDVMPDVFRRLCQAREYSRLYSVVTVGKFLISVVLTLALVVGMNLGVLGVLLASLMSSVLFFGVSCYLLLPDLTFDFQWSRLKSSIKYGIPMIPPPFI